MRSAHLDADILQILRNRLTRQAQIKITAPLSRSCPHRKISGLEIRSGDKDVQNYGKITTIPRSGWMQREVRGERNTEDQPRSTGRFRIARNKRASGSWSLDDASGEANRVQDNKAQLALKQKAADLFKNKSKRKGQSSKQPTEPATGIEDELYVKTTMQIPKASDYPDIDLEVFMYPKAAFRGRLQGLVTLSSQFSQLSKDVHRCFLSFKGPQREKVVMGEGRTPVNLSNSVSCDLLTVLIENS